MFRSEILYVVLLAFVVLGAPYLPTMPLMLLDHLVIRLAAVMVLLFLIRMGPTAGIFGLIAIAVLYMERNRRKVDHALAKLDAMDPETPQPAKLEEALAPQTTVPVKPFDTPDEEEFSFVPKDIHDDTCSDMNFEPVAPSINEKAVLSSAYPSRGSASAAADFYEELGVGHVL